MSLFQYIKQFNPNKVNGEKTPVYALDEFAMKKICEAIPDVKIIICVRNPMQAMHSFYAHRVRSPFLSKLYGSGNNKINFEDVVLKDLRRHSFSSETFCYFKHLKENVLKYFKKNQVYIVVQERMAKNTDDEMNKVFKFLNIPPHYREWLTFKTYNNKGQYEAINYNSEKHIKVVNKLQNLYKPYNEQLFGFLGERIMEWENFNE